MNIDFSPSDIPDGLLIALWFAGILASLFWMVVGWRAMRAHERIAAALEKQAPPDG